MARAVAAALRRRGAEAEIVLNAFAWGGHWLAWIAGLYGPLTRHVPWAWRLLWVAGATGSRSDMVNQLITHTTSRGLLAWARRWRPHLILSVHPFFCTPLLNLRPKLQAAGVRALAIQITDLATVTHLWLDQRADRIYCPTPDVRRTCRELGITDDRLVLTGLPFTPGTPRPEWQALSRTERRVALGFDSRPLIVLGASGEGQGRIRPAMRRLAARTDWQIVVVTGRAVSLRRALEREAKRWPHVQVLGFIDYVPDLLRVADVLVAKAGPTLIVEAAAAGVPLVITDYLPGQEEGNLQLVECCGLGAVELDLSRLLPAVEAALAAARDAEPPRLPFPYGQEAAELTAAKLLELIETTAPGSKAQSAMLKGP